MVQARCITPARRGRALALVALLVAVMLGWGVRVAPVAQAAVATKVTPPAGAVGTAVTVVGDGLAGVSAVTFLGAADPGDDVDAEHYIVMDPKKVLVQVPPGAKTGPLALTTPDGVAATDPVVYTVYEAPTITVLSATSGAAATAITITGDNLLGAKKPAVAFGNKKTGALIGSTQTELLVKVPAGLPGGPVPVTVTTTGGTAASNFVIGPDVKAVAPISGSTAGGTVVSIKGTGFTGVTTFTDDPATAGVDERFDGVTFGGNRVTKLLAVSDKELVVQTPAGTDGLADVVVRTKHDSTVATSAKPATFTYQPLPVVTTAPSTPTVGTPVVKSMAPSLGAPGTTVDLKGTLLDRVTELEFTGADDTWVNAPTFLAVGTTRLVVTVPAGAVSGELRISHATGRYVTEGRVFRATTVPTITSIDAVGDGILGVAPGDLLVVKGTGLYMRGARTNVTIGGKVAPVQMRPKPTAKTIVVKVPASMGGREPVVVTTPLGLDTSVDEVYFVPDVTAVKPQTYSRAGGTIATVVGIGFTGVDNVTIGEGRPSAVTFGGVPAARLVAVSDKMLVAVTAPGSASADDLVVSTQHAGKVGDSNGKTRSANAPTPRVTNVSPNNGPTGSAPPAVTLTGEHLTVDSVVRFGASTGVVQSAAPDGTSLVVVPPTRATASTVSITVVNVDDGDELLTTVPGAYTYTLQPARVTSMSASAGLPNATVTISGTSFVGVTSVKFGTAEVVHTVVNDNTIYATVPATPAGAGGTVVDVTVVNSTGQPSTGDPVTADDWTWDNSPTLTSLSASTGNKDATVTITGTNFVGVTAVRFGATPATSYIVVDSTTITAVVPTTPTGAGGTTTDVVVVVGALTSLPANATVDNWTWVAPAVVTAMDLHTGPSGTVVTVTGTGLSGLTSVIIHNKPVTSYTVINATSMTFVAPGGDVSGPTSVGSTRDMRITNGSGAVSTANPANADDWTFM